MLVILIKNKQDSIFFFLQIAMELICDFDQQLIIL